MLKSLHIAVVICCCCCDIKSERAKMNENIVKIPNMIKIRFNCDQNVRKLIEKSMGVQWTHTVFNV